MKYYLIVGEASGDLHASNLMKALKDVDSKAEFRYFGGDLMSAVSGELVRHYRDTAFMGVLPVLMNLRTIFSNMRLCKRDILEWRPDALILVDYPGFNLSIAEYIHKNSDIPVYYYISPKIWAWKEYRIKNIKRDVDKLFSILPFEVDFFAKHNFPIHYVGNPCVDAVADFLNNDKESRESFVATETLSGKPVVALLAGSRKREIRSNLPLMLEAVKSYPELQPVIAAAPGIDPSFYAPYISNDVKIIYGGTYRLLKHSEAALVTSGTATLETALFRVPQVVCFATPLPKIYSWLKRNFLKVKYISLVNLIAGRSVVTELVAADMSLSNIISELGKLLPGTKERAIMLKEYDRIISILGDAGASQRAASIMAGSIKDKRES